MSLITDTGDASGLIKYLAESIPKGEHLNPHNELVPVRLDVVQESIDHIEWLEKGIEEWRNMYLSSDKQNKALRANCQIAIGHLQNVLNKPISHDEQLKADTEAREWLVSIGSEPD